jgi:hypothetical protein
VVVEQEEDAFVNFGEGPALEDESLSARALNVPSDLDSTAKPMAGRSKHN